MGNKSSRKGKRDPTGLGEDDLKFLKTNTQYSEEEIEAWHAGFLKDCPSGQLDKKQFLSLYRVGAFITCQRFFLSALINRDSIRMANQINTVISSSKPSTRIIITGSILRNSCKRERQTTISTCSLLFGTFSLAVGVSQHGNLGEKLNMAFDIYGKDIPRRTNRVSKECFLRSK